MTRTYTTLFDSETVDRVMGEAFRTLESDFESRREYIDRPTQIAIEARLSLLRSTWVVLLDRSDAV